MAKPKAQSPKPKAQSPKIKPETIPEIKDRLIREIDAARIRVFEQSNEIPDHVLHGDAKISAAWRDRAEQIRFRRPYAKVANKRKTVEQLKELLAEENELIASLTTDIKVGSSPKKIDDQLDMFA